MLVGFGKAGWLAKAQQQPEKVRMVLKKVRTDGLVTTAEAIKSKLDQPFPLGYCNVGVVSEVGVGVTGFKTGDRVVSNGSHADMVVVPERLCARIPEAVDDETASFAIVASIALQGVRLAQPTLGELFVVTGVGLIGLLAVQILRAHGCQVLAIDYDESKLALARHYGANTCCLGRGEDPVVAGMALSGGIGVDGVIIAASTKSSDPVAQAAQMCRKRGRIVLVGVTGLELDRADFYKKELTFQVSCSYGPGRYDSSYEMDGVDYPVGFVRWTAQRNFLAVLQLMATGAISVKGLISGRFSIDDASMAYQALTSESSGLAILLVYGSPDDSRKIRSIVLRPSASYEPERAVVGVLGAGNYASRVLIPAFKNRGAQLRSITTSGGVSAAIYGAKAGFEIAASDIANVFNDPIVNTIVIATRHDSHASLTVSALRAGKNVFVEKPLAISLQSLAQVQDAYKEVVAEGKQVRLMVGYNRRFAPHVVTMKRLMQGTPGPKCFIMTVNAGAIPADHWTQDAEVGGGRIVGEACHFIDLMRFLADSQIGSVSAVKLNVKEAAGPSDNVMISICFSDGSIGTINYLANGSASFPKERLEVFVDGRILHLDNFRVLKGFGWPGFSTSRLWRQDKGQDACVAAFLKSVESGAPAPIPHDEIFEVAQATISVAESIR